MTLQIPNIDISNGLDTPELIEQLQDACEGWGFFQITGHGIDIELRQKFFSAMTAFFDLPKAKKLQLSRSEHNYWGYYDKELTKNKLDSKEIFDIDANLCRLGKLRSDHPVPWPNEIPQLQTIVIDWLQACEKLSQNLVAAIWVAMGQASKTLSPCFLLGSRKRPGGSLPLLHPKRDPRNASSRTGGYPPRRHVPPMNW